MAEVPSRRVLDEKERRIVMQALADYDKARSLDSSMARAARRLYGELHDACLVLESSPGARYDDASNQ